MITFVNWIFKKWQMAADYTLSEHTPVAFCPGVRVGLMERTAYSWVTFNKPCDHRKQLDPKR